MRVSAIAAVLMLMVFATQTGLGEQTVLERKNLIKRGGLFCEASAYRPFTGTAVEYWPNGQKKEEAEYRDGKKHGVTTEWYESGQKKSEIEYHDGREHGKLTLWYENGQKMAEWELRYGSRHGMHIRWFENGKKNLVIKFRNDRQVSAKQWDQDGNPVE